MLKQQAVQMSAGVDALFQKLLFSHGPKDDIELSRHEVRILITLFNKGESTMGDLASTISIPLSTATRAVDRLVKKGMTERIRSEEDRRIVQVTLSQLGKENGQQMLEGRQKMARLMLMALNPAERSAFLKLLVKVVRHASASDSVKAEK